VQSNADRDGHAGLRCGKNFDMTSRFRPYLYLLAITAGALLIHGYHPAAEDAEIYIPGIKKLLNPQLYPFGAEFFLNHARLTLFPSLMASSVRLFHLSLDVTVLLWYLACIFLTLLACWRLSSECFDRPEARWASVLTVAAVLTIPVAGTSLYISDQYLTSRSLVTFALLFGAWSALTGRRTAWFLWSVFAICIHPLMALFGISFSALLWWTLRNESFLKGNWAPVCGVFSIFNLLPRASDAYVQAIDTRSYFFILRWHWYELLGAIAPLLVLWLIGRLCARRSLHSAQMLANALIGYGMIYFAATLMLTIPARFQTVARLQPMRSLHLLYILMFLLGGGVLGEWILQRRVWRWAAFFLPLCAAMFLVQCELFPASPHIEWPNAVPQNDWLQAFDWVRRNTPVDALFAIDPDYMNKDDQHGFRAIAERSRLADAVKDSGAVTMFPELPAADHWLEQLTAQRGWNHFQEDDFHRLETIYGVRWVVSPQPFPVRLACPYQNRTVRICRLD
jgi:hypothetical protein